MTERKWGRGKSHLDTMIRFLEQQVDSRRNRRLMLFGCACCRRVWDLLHLEAGRRIVVLAEAYADGEATAEELQSAATFDEISNLLSEFNMEYNEQVSFRTARAYHAARSLAVSPPLNKARAYYAALGLMETPIDVGAIVKGTSGDIAHDFILSAENHFGNGLYIKLDETEINEKKKIIRDIFGNPFREVNFASEWRTNHTVDIAKTMYNERNFDIMPILADALEEAGCDNWNILKHCREPGIHVRGCWVVDLVLGK